MTYEQKTREGFFWLWCCFFSVCILDSHTSLVLPGTHSVDQSGLRLVPGFLPTGLHMYKFFRVFPKWTFSSSMHIFSLFVPVFCIECDIEEVWALRTLSHSSGGAGFSLSCPGLPTLLGDWGLGSLPAPSCQEEEGKWICNLWLFLMPYSEFLYSKMFVGRHMLFQPEQNNSEAAPAWSSLCQDAETWVAPETAWDGVCHRRDLSP